MRADTSYVIDFAGPLVTINDASLRQVVIDETWSAFVSGLGGVHPHLLRSVPEMYHALQRRLSRRQSEDVLALCHEAVKPALDLRVVRNVIGSAPCVVTAECDPVTLLAAQHYILPRVPTASIVSSSTVGARKSHPSFWKAVRNQLGLPSGRSVVVITQSADPLEVTQMEAVFQGLNYSRVTFEPHNALAQWQRFAQSRQEAATA